jgi:hypothetical protein
MKEFTKNEILELYGQVTLGEISFSRMVEIMNERVSEADKPCVEDIPKRKFKKGDKVRIKEGVSSKTHGTEFPWFNEYMDELIGATMTVDRYTDLCNHVKCEGLCWYFIEDWLEPYVEELKQGDLAIFWDNGGKHRASVRMYGGLFMCDYYDTGGVRWDNAIKFESKEQYERLIKGGDMTTKTTYSFSVSFNGKGNNYRVEPILDGKQTSITEYKVVDEFGNTVFVGDAESCNIFVNGAEITRIAKELI